jgi:SAM-dependent methyltransferase
MDAAAWDERYAADGLLWTSQPNNFLVSETADLVPGRALDVACGEGRNAIWLAARGWRVTAVDHSAVGLGKGAELATLAGIDVEWVTADVVTYAPEPVYDLVVVLYLHLPPDDMRTAVGHAAGGLAPGGTLLLVGHHPDNIERGIGGPQLPEVLHSEADIAAMLDGLRIEKATMVERAVDRAGVTGIALDTLVSAIRDKG